MPRPFRFIARLPDFDRPRDAWRAEVARIEDLGFDTVALSDHFTGGAVAEPVVALTAAAMASERLRLLCIVFGNDYRHPVMLHKSLANLDVLSGGRVEVGLGAGWMTADYEAAGLAYDPPGVRVSRLEEAAQVVKGLFGKEPLTFAGEHYRIAALDGLPKPVQQPRPPLMIGGGGRRVLSMAAREAEIVGINANLRAGAVTPEAARDFLPEAVDDKLRWVREAAAAAGRSLDDIDIHVNTFMSRVTATEEEAAEAVAPVAQMYGVDPATVAESPAILVGTVDQCVQRLEERRRRWGMNYIGLNCPLEQAAPIVAALAGR